MSQVNYESIRYSTPYNMRRRRGERKIKFWQSLLFFICLMAASEIVVTLVYIYTGISQMGATVLQQLIFLAASVLFVRLSGADLKKVFPLHRPRAEAVFGVCILAAASYLAADVISIWTYYIAPVQLDAVSDGMDGIFTGFLPEFFVLVILPPICEEALHRGVILIGCRNSFRRKWVVILVNGFIFGIFHIYPVRWAAPMFIGCIMAWIVLTTDNMIYSSMLHALYNLFILLASYASAAFYGNEPAASAVSTSVSLTSVGFITLFYGIPISFLLYIGCWLIRRAEAPSAPAFLEKGREKKQLLQIFLPAFIILIIGLGLIAAGT